MLKLGFVPDVGVEGFGDEVVPGLRVGGDGLLEEPVEAQPAAARVGPVELEGELVEVVGKLMFGDCAGRIRRDRGFRAGR